MKQMKLEVVFKKVTGQSAQQSLTLKNPVGCSSSTPDIHAEISSLSQM